MFMGKTTRFVCCPKCNHSFPMITPKRYEKVCETCHQPFVSGNKMEKTCSLKCWKSHPRRKLRMRQAKARNYARRKSDPKYMAKCSEKASKYITERCKRDPVFRIKMNLRNRARKMMVSNQVSISRAIGCNSEQLRKHFESQFKPGMTWDNYGSHWVIDHIIPLSAYDLSIPEHVLEANHYTNLQPLTKLANSIKGDSIV